LDKHIAFITYETPYAPGGGIAAVMAHLPQAVQSVSQVPTFVVTPFHFKIEKTFRRETEMDTIASFAINFYSKQITVEVKYFYKEVGWIFLKPILPKTSSFQLFSGNRHPYDVHTASSISQSNLLFDSLFFGKAAAGALEIICPDCHWTILMQDWEAATCTLALVQKDSNKNIQSSYLTMHNSYDSGINQDILAGAGLEDLPIKGHTVLETALQVVQDPVFTVSEQFALDLSGEIFQSEIMIPHITHQVSQRLYGINNGPFIDNQIPEEVLQAGLEDDVAPLSEWKDLKRTQALEIIRCFTPTQEEPIWGDINIFSGATLPWFVMAGRDDSRQKGYELACLAVDKFLEQSDQACFIFFPIPGDEGLEGIQFIQDLASKYPARVLCFPFLFREGYFPILQGATFGMMPSYYEPFGMANEFFLNGSSCLGRATGGIIQQIVPYRDAKSFNNAVSARSDRWHSNKASPSGFLFREEDGIENALADWRAINAADYIINTPDKNRLKKRGALTLIRKMSSEMNSCINDAVNLYTSDRVKYFEFIISGISYISKNFSWESAAQKYIDEIKI
jgi:glycogen synthase